MSLGPNSDAQHDLGPGMYNVNLNGSAKAFTFGLKVENKPNNNPGPG